MPRKKDMIIKELEPRVYNLIEGCHKARHVLSYSERAKSGCDRRTSALCPVLPAGARSSTAAIYGRRLRRTEANVMKALHSIARITFAAVMYPKKTRRKRAFISFRPLVTVSACVECQKPRDQGPAGQGCQVPGLECSECSDRTSCND